MENQVFIQYSGIWGNPGTIFFSSGYWGPAFNETTMGNDGFVTAWCAGMKSQTREECYPPQLAGSGWDKSEALCWSNV
jgi:hypothetical protein